jgi:DNA-binding response OmpR family regulator
MASDSSQTIVVVDDSPTIKKLFERGMRDLDVSLKIFRSANACWKYLQSNKPDLLFLNIKMPGKDGLTLLKEIRELPLHKDTSVVMISSKDYAQDRSIANDLGALDFITKPMPIQALRDVVIKHLNIDPAN